MRKKTLLLWKRKKYMTQYFRNIFVASAIFTGFGIAPAASASEKTEVAQIQIPKVTVADGRLELTAPDGMSVRFDIYSITGQLIKSLDLQSETALVELPQGCYIVHTPGRSVKILVK